jgi:hypothetical protein
MSTQRYYSQIPSKLKYLQTVIDTMWLYPIADIKTALANTTHRYTFDGTNLVCPDYESLRGIYYDIYAQTATTQPLGSNPGFSLGVGTNLEDMGQEIFLKVGDETWIHWRNVRQLTPQSVSIIPSPGNSPAGTIGYITTFVSFGQNNPAPSIFDKAYVVRVG